MGQNKTEKTAALVVAAGRGYRAGGGMPKQYRLLNNEPVLTRSLRALLCEPAIDRFLCVIHPDDQSLYQALLHHSRNVKKKKSCPPLSVARHASNPCSPD